MLQMGKGFVAALQRVWADWQDTP